MKIENFMPSYKNTGVDKKFSGLFSEPEKRHMGFSLLFRLTVMVLCSLVVSSGVFALEQWGEGPIRDQLFARQDAKDAFGRRAEREKKIDEFLKSGMAGESNLGYLRTMFMDIPEKDRALMEEENRDRLVILTAVAEILASSEGLKLTEENLQAKFPAAIKYFCDLREKYVPKGTMIQNPDGKWVQKY
ncbi:MAG: YdbL family protein [Firmicutes bacterium]|nr:YdbL family protein [Bacillota bacterium]